MGLGTGKGWVGAWVVGMGTEGLCYISRVGIWAGPLLLLGQIGQYVQIRFFSFVRLTECWNQINRSNFGSWEPGTEPGTEYFGFGYFSFGFG